MADESYEEKKKRNVQKFKDRLEGENYVKDVTGKWILKSGKLHEKTKGLPLRDRIKTKENEEKKMKKWILRKKAKDGK